MATEVKRARRSERADTRTGTKTRRVAPTVDDIFRLRMPSDVQLAPDGQRAAFVVADWVPDQTTPRTRVWLVDTAGGEPRQVTDGPRHDACPRWSPDSRTLAFISDRGDEGDDKQSQLYVVAAEGGDARRICRVPNGVGELAWSPDGTRIAFVADEGPEPSKDPIVGYGDRHRRLWTVRPESDTPVAVTPPDLTIWLYAWAPGSDRFAVFFAEKPGENGWYRGQLGVVAAEGGAVRQMGTLDRQAAALAWSPDGKRLTFVKGEWSDRPLVGGDLWSVTVGADADADGEPRNLTPGAEVSVSWAGWFPEGDRLLVVAHDRAWSQIGVLDAAGGEIHPLASEIVVGEGFWPQVSATPDRRHFAALRTDPETPPDLWLGELTAGHNGAREGISWRRLTRLNPIAEETMERYPTEVIRYAGADGWPIDAVLIMPREAKRGTPPPLVVLVHGGPSAANRAAWFGPREPQLYAAAGFAVLLPNFRGSLGRGVAFADAILGDMGGKDLEDVLCGVEHLVAAGRVDGDRVGIAGWSYGGFASAWAITQTTRFKAAMVGAGVTDFHSFHAECNIPDWDRRFIAADPYAEPEAYRARSAITFVERVTTPTLILHGEQDPCVPVNQAHAFYRALRERGVPAELVVYPREGHGVRERDHVRDMIGRLLAWWERWL